MPPLEENLWETISQIAESVKGIPPWQMGSVQNCRTEDFTSQDEETCNGVHAHECESRATGDSLTHF